MYLIIPVESGTCRGANFDSKVLIFLGVVFSFDCIKVLILEGSSTFLMSTSKLH